ncbi:hypothetical protein EYF80_020043 [Liparis tanakae]|uniref:Uncharacterized protein n=1 Tax=Liparis tanakae TaxID=230148 RepID=A0A4Z2HV20_9TELE|nr:hypothetical protein EYF80_020043 [Liparis tanakae]
MVELDEKSGRANHDGPWRQSLSGAGRYAAQGATRRRALRGAGRYAAPGATRRRALRGAGRYSGAFQELKTSLQNEELAGLRSDWSTGGCDLSPVVGSNAAVWLDANRRDLEDRPCWRRTGSSSGGSRWTLQLELSGLKRSNDEAAVHYILSLRPLPHT